MVLSVNKAGLVPFSSFAEQQLLLQPVFLSSSNGSLVQEEEEQVVVFSLSHKSFLTTQHRFEEHVSGPEPR